MRSIISLSSPPPCADEEARAHPEAAAGSAEEADSAETTGTEGTPFQPSPDLA